MSKYKNKQLQKGLIIPGVETVKTPTVTPVTESSRWNRDCRGNKGDPRLNLHDSF